MKALVSKFPIMAELIAFFWHQKLWWMLPIAAAWMSHDFRPKLSDRPVYLHALLTPGICESIPLVVKKLRIGHTIRGRWSLKGKISANSVLWAG